jgi:hypothetical protein
MNPRKVRISGMVFNVLDVGPIRDGYVMVLFRNWAHHRYPVHLVEVILGHCDHV